VPEPSRASASSSSDVAALTARLAPVYALADGFVTSGLVPGAVLHVTHRGVASVRAFGRARPAATVPLAADAIFPLFSATKPLVASAVLSAADDGLLDLDDRVARHLPAFAARGKGDVTLRHLLSHSAGIPAAPDEDLGRFASNEAFVATLLPMAPTEPPGRRGVYHATTAFALLAAVLSRVTGATAGEALRARVLAPLRMADTMLGGPDAADPRAARVTLVHAPPGDADAARWAEAANGMVFRKAGHGGAGVFASAADLARFLQMWLHEGVSPETGARVLRAETAREALRIQQPGLREGMPPFVPPALRDLDLGPTTWGLGWRLRGDPPEPLFGFGAASARAFGHNGLGAVACWADPERDLACVWLTNALLGLGDALRTRVQLARAVVDACW
jgi:CubicO group peptidase (beta-lactamase class C family)